MDTEQQCTYQCGYLASPNYPAMYPDSITVTWNIQIEQNTYIHLEFLTFQVESELPECGQDYVEVYNVLRNISTKLMGRYCTSNAPPAFLRSSMNNMTVVFRSDMQYSTSGFLAHYYSEHYTLPANIENDIENSGKNTLKLHFHESVYTMFVVDHAHGQNVPCHRIIQCVNPTTCL